MSFIDDVVERFVKEPDYGYSTEILWILTFVMLLVAGVIIFLALKARSKTRELGTSKGVQAFVRTMFFLSIVPIGATISYGYRALVANDSAIFLGNSNLFYPLGAGLFVIYYTTYITNTINLSNFVRNGFKIFYFGAWAATLIVFGSMIIKLVVPIDDLFLNTFFFFMALFFFADVFFTLLFAGIDYFRISNKLTKVRLGLSGIAGITFIINALFVVLYYYSVVNADTLSWLIPISAVLLYSFTFPTAIFMYWGFFIPEKIQEWTGILPPSFKMLKEKRKQLAKKKVGGES